MEAPASWMAAVHQTLRKYGVNIAVDTAVRTISPHALGTGKEVGHGLLGSDIPQ